jgi:NADH:ubiquinone oxidoreductase subunit E
MNTDQETAITQIISRYPGRESAIMPVLQYFQKENGNYLSPEAIEQTAKIIGCSKSRVYGVATYYTMCNTKPVG